MKYVTQPLNVVNYTCLKAWPKPSDTTDIAPEGWAFFAACFALANFSLRRRCLSFFFSAHFSDR